MKNQITGKINTRFSREKKEVLKGETPNCEFITRGFFYPPCVKLRGNGQVDSKRINKKWWRLASFNCQDIEMATEN